MVSVSKIIQGGAKKIGGFGEETSAKVFGKTAPDDTITKMGDGDILVKSMPEEEVVELNKIIADTGVLGNTGYQGPPLDFGLNFARIGEIFDRAELLADDSARLVGNLMEDIKVQNKALFKEMKRDKQTIEDLLKLAERAGVDAKMYKFLQMKPGEMRPPEDVVGGIIAIIRLTKELDHGVQLALQATGPEKAALMQKIARVGAIQTNLSAKVSAVVSEYGRGLAVVRNVQKLEGLNLKDYSEQLSDFLKVWDETSIDFNTMDESEMNLKLRQYNSLPNPSKAKYIEKGPWAKSYDAAMEIYINALLTSPVTHFVNIGGNFAFQTQRLVERGVAGFIGEIRTSRLMPSRFRGQDTDRVYMGEMAAETHAMIMSLKDAFTLMGRTLITGESGDFASKIDLRNLRSIGKEDNIGKIMENAGKGDFTGMFYDVLGVATRIPGRFLASEDEFFKVISRRRVQYREASKRSSIDYRLAIKAGKTKEEAKDLSSQTYADVMTNPPSDVLDMMELEAKEMTFQSDLEGIAAKIGGVANLPGVKVVVPFYKTPANIVQNVWDRSFNLYPVAKAIKKGIGPKGSGGREFDDAMSKLATGWGVMSAMVYFASGLYGDDIIVTGTGPSDRKARKLMADKGIQPYSIGIKNDDGTYQTFTFSRMDPLSGLLAMAADMAYYMRDSDLSEDPKFIDAMMSAATLSAAQYSTNMPFLQGVSELMTALGNPYDDKEGIIERLQLFAGKKVGDVGTAISGSVQGRMTFGLGAYFAEQADIPVIGATSFSGAMERYLNPTASNTMLPDEYIFGTHSTELHPFLQGFYKAVQEAKARHPSFSDQLPPGLDFWGNERQTSKGTFEEFFNPIRTTHNAELTPLDQELIRLSEVDAGTFSMHKKSIEGVKLSAQDYNDYIYLINNYDEEGRLPGDRGYNSEETLLNTLNSYMDPTTDNGAFYFGASRDKDKNAFDDESRYNLLSAEVTQRRSYARKFMRENVGRIREVVEEKELLKSGY